MFLMMGKGNRGEYVTLFIDMQRLITNTSKIMIKITNRHIFNWDTNNLYECHKNFQ